MHKQLLESNGIGAPRLDKERGIVRGVKILGMKSSHGYGYSAAAMRAAVGLYEGKAVNIDHPTDRAKLGASRSYRDRFAKILQVRYLEGEGLFGNLHYNKGHQLARQFEWDVEHHPDNLGLSHNATGRASGDGQLVEAIEAVRSVDLVADPATTMGLFEARGSGLAGPPPVRTLPQVAADAAYGIVANADIDVGQKRRLLMGLLDLFGDEMESDADEDFDSDAEPAVDSAGVGPRAGGGIAESRLLDLLPDGDRDDRRRLLEERRLDKEPRFDLRSLLN